MQSGVWVVVREYEGVFEDAATRDAIEIISAVGCMPADLLVPPNLRSTSRSLGRLRENTRNRDAQSSRRVSSLSYGQLCRSKLGLDIDEDSPGYTINHGDHILYTFGLEHCLHPA
jgi:hypothetical protein